MFTCANNIDAARELNKVRRSLRKLNNYLGLRKGIVYSYNTKAKTGSPLPVSFNKERVLIRLKLEINVRNARIISTSSCLVLFTVLAIKSRQNSVYES